MSVFVGASVGQMLLKLVASVHMLAKMGQNSGSTGQCWSKFGNGCPSFARLWLTLARSGQMLANVGQVRQDMAQHRPSLVKRGQS